MSRAYRNRKKQSRDEKEQYQLRYPGGRAAPLPPKIEVKLPSVLAELGKENPEVADRALAIIEKANDDAKELEMRDLDIREKEVELENKKLDHDNQLIKDTKEAFQAFNAHANKELNLNWFHAITDKGFWLLCFGLIAWCIITDRTEGTIAFSSLTALIGVLSVIKKKGKGNNSVIPRPEEIEEEPPPNGSS